MITGAAVRYRVDVARIENEDLHALLKVLEGAGRVAVVGGAVRDWATGRAPRDLDFMVDVPDWQLPRLLQAYPVETTRFGGYTVHVGGVGVDVWPLSGTHAFAKGEVAGPATFARWPLTPTLSADAALVTLDDGVLHDGGLAATLASGVLDVVNPSRIFPTAIVAKTAALCQRYGWSLGPGLRAWLADNGRSARVAHLDVALALRYGLEPDERREALKRLSPFIEQRI